MSDRPRHLVIAAGGTGGHFFPALAIAREFRNRGGNVTFAVAGQHCEEHIRLATAEGFGAVPFPGPRLPRHRCALPLFAVNMGWARLVASRLLRRIYPDILLGMGSFAAAPACLAAAQRQTPLFLHEGNTVIGRANAFLTRHAKALMLSFPLQAGQHPACPTAITGMPVRESLLKAAAVPINQAAARVRFGLQPDRPTLLLFGGSQGAEALNQLMQQLAAQLADSTQQVQLLHLTGQPDNAELAAHYARHGLLAEVRQYESEMHYCYAAADLVICRAGAGTLAELALFGKPAVLIPLPSSANQHQTANALFFAKSDAALHVPQAEASPERAAIIVRGWLAQPETWQQRGRRMRSLACPGAARQAADLMLNPAYA
jgi:UDP-N-acetylglucosamine--N-acetylmuramyl-(pentapeptide) pyrophosphoryl-undecaprenol N-acetylglucosamine transferase